MFSCCSHQSWRPPSLSGGGGEGGWGGSLRRRRRLRRIDERERGQREAAGKKDEPLGWRRSSITATRRSCPERVNNAGRDRGLRWCERLRLSAGPRAEAQVHVPPSWNQLGVSDLVGVLTEGPWGCCESLLVEVKFIFRAGVLLQTHEDVTLGTEPFCQRLRLKRCCGNDRLSKHAGSLSPGHAPALSWAFVTVKVVFFFFSPQKTCPEIRRCCFCPLAVSDVRWRNNWNREVFWERCVQPPSGDPQNQRLLTGPILL